MEVNKFLSYGLNIDENFNKIRNKEEYQSLLENTRTKKIKYRKLKFVMYTLSVVLITVFSTLLVNNYFTSNNSIGSVDPGKPTNFVEGGYFEKVICFGPEVAKCLYKSEIIFNSNIIKEEDKNILKEYLDEQKKIKPGHVNYFQICFGIKDGKDIVFLGDLSPAGKHGAELFIFESNLDYTFESILVDFENMTNTELTDDFLEASKYENGKQVMGIILNFNQNEEGIYIPYYKVIIDDKVYVLNK